MPIYEFYCLRCNTIYNFFSKVVNTDKVPKCPSCKTIKLKRQMSVFAKISGGKEAFRWRRRDASVGTMPRWKRPSPCWPVKRMPSMRTIPVRLQT